MKTRLFSLWLLLSVAVGLSAYDFKVNGLCYNITSSKTPYTVEVTYEQYPNSGPAYKSLTTANIPESVTYNNNVYRVTRIGDDAFHNCSDLTSVTIPNSVTRIGDWAFYDCSSLTSIAIPNSVTSIGVGAFCKCWSLTSIAIPYSVMSIGGSAFYDCSSLTSITIPNNVTSIGESAFYACSSLTSITIPNSVTSIGVYAFEGCSSLTAVAWNAKNCDGFSEKSTPFYYYNGDYYNDFDIRQQITSFVFGDSVQHIPDYLCTGMENLPSITIGKSVTSIGDNAFKGCSSITSVVWNAENYKGENAPYSSSPVSKQITSFVFGDSVQYIPARLCNGMENLTSIIIPNSVTSIGYNAFLGCTGLTKVNYIGDVKGWLNIELDSNPIVYAQDLYINNILLTELTIPDDITYISSAFSNCRSLTSVTIPNSVASIGGSAFSNCTGLTSITIPNSVTGIGNNAFSGCRGLTSVTIPNSVTSIGGSAFSNCTSLTSITIPNSVTDIGSRAFSDCTGLTSVVIGNGVTNIEDNAFKGCKNVETVVFGSAVETIGASAFAGCQSIYEMTIYATKVPTIQENTFTEVGTGATLRVPAGCAKKYKAHPYWGVFNIEEIPSEYTITVTCDPQLGQVSGSGTYTDGSEVTLTAVPNKGYAFTQWSDGNKDNPRKVTVTADATYTAEFALQNYVVSATCDPQQGQVTGGGTYPYGSEVTLTATPNNGYEFKQWSDGSIANPYSFSIEKDVSIEALFVPTTPVVNVAAEESDTPRKVFRDGQVYILRGGKTYTITGVEVE